MCFLQQISPQKQGISILEIECSWLVTRASNGLKA